MRFCTTCGRQLRGDARFCTGCGDPVPAAPPAAGPLPEPAQASEQPTLDAFGSTDSPGQASSGYAAGEPGRYTAGHPGRYTPGHPGSYADDQPSRYTPGQPGGYPDDQPGRYTPGQPGGYPGDQPGRYTPGQPGRYPGGQPGRYGGGAPAAFSGGPPAAYSGGPQAAYSGGPPAHPGGPPAIDAPARRGPPGIPPRRRRAGRSAIVAGIAIVVVAGGAAAGVLLSRGPHAAPVALRSRATGNHSTAVATQSSRPTTSSSSAPSRPATSGHGVVRVAPGLSGNPLATPVTALLDKYFTAISNRDYQSYISLLSPQEQQGLTPAVFNNGYRSTRDSAEMLVSISTTNGTVAIVTFTSHQNPADSVNGQESCTKWQISMFLQQNGSDYLIGKPPASYHALHAACL